MAAGLDDDCAQGLVKLREARGENDKPRAGVRTPRTDVRRALALWESVDVQLDDDNVDDEQRNGNDDDEHRAQVS